MRISDWSSDVCSSDLGRAADQLDHTEGVWRLGALTPAHEQHPDHAMLQQIRGGVRRLDEQAGRSYDETSERISRCLLANCKECTPMPTRIDHVDRKSTRLNSSH